MILSIVDKGQRHLLAVASRAGGNVDMRSRLFVHAAALLAALGLILSSSLPLIAGTTGQLRGRVNDGATKAPLAGVKVSIVSPSQSVTTVTDAQGAFSFISLAPDTYTVTLSKDGYDSSSVAGVTVVSDQTQTFNFELTKTTKTLALIRVRAATGIVHPGTTSDVYAINAATQKTASGVGGPGGVDYGYSGLATVPGVYILQGQQGWEQLISVRGGDPGDVAVELDGIPMSRSSDGGTTSTLSSLGQQELQAYTGGTPASAEANGLSGYLNQVIRTGTYPSFSTLTAGVGFPAFYHKLSYETGGASPSRSFTYYIATSGVNQDYRYGDQFNNVGGINAFFYPLNVTGNNGIYDGTVPASFSPGVANALAFTNDRETIANFHFALPHRRDTGRDDVQLLYVTSEIFARFYSSVNDLGGLSLITPILGQPTWTDIDYYSGQVFAPPDPSKLVTYRFPSSPTNRFIGAPLDPNQRDGNENGMGVGKLQYQHNFSPRTYLRTFGYINYSNWFINGPVSTFFPFGGQISDYEVVEHAWGATSIFQSELSEKHLLTVTAGYEKQKDATYSSSSFGIVTTNFIDAAGNCYSPSSGAFASCFPNASPFQNTNDAINLYSQFGVPISGTLSPPVTAGPTSPAIVNGAQWIVTENGIKTEQQDSVVPIRSSLSVTDQLHPNDRLTANAGLRFERFDYKLGDTANPALWPARAFWFKAFNRENCYAAGQPAAVSATLNSDGTWTCPAGTAPVNLQNTHPNVVTYSALEPRFGFSYTLSPERVLRGSYGRYVGSPSSSDLEINATQQDLATRLAPYLPAGYSTPYHDTRPDYADNLDLSLEQRLHGTDYSFSLSPFYRTTRNQVESVPIGVQGDVAGLNTGRQRSYGFEFEFKKGDYGTDGVSWQISYAYTQSRVTYGNFGTAGQNFVDTLNAYVQHYNSFTSACQTGDQVLCGSYGSTNAMPLFPLPGSGSVSNPYFAQPAQPLFDRNAQYSPYTILPSPLQAAVGYETPNVLTGLLSYRRGRITLTPSITYTSGSYYGSPLVWPGYDPTTCTGVVSGTTADTTTCSQGNTPLFLPDPYSGHFDAQGEFREPSRMTGNFQIGYEASKNVDATLVITSIFDHCYQRGYAWDNPSTCVYGQLPSNALAPVGNFVPLDQAPPQLRFPYSSWLNNLWVGYVGQRLPTTAFFNVQFKL
jgi:hypothetical protein